MWWRDKKIIDLSVAWYCSEFAIKLKYISEKVRNPYYKYFLVGCLNTSAGYLIGLMVYLALGPIFHILLVGLVANVLSITFSYMSYKILVFKTENKWLVELLRCFMVFGVSGLLGTFFLWGLVDGLSIPFWVSQGIVIVFLAFFSFFANSKFTFRNSRGERFN